MDKNKKKTETLPLAGVTFVVANVVNVVNVVVHNFFAVTIERERTKGWTVKRERKRNKNNVVVVVVVVVDVVGNLHLTKDL